MNDPAQADGARRWVIAVAAVALIIGVKLLLNGLGADHPFVLLPAAVAVAAWYGGTGPGVLATLLVAAASLYFLVPPVGPGVETSDIVAIGGLIAEGALVVALTVGLRSARLRAETASAASAAAHRETAFALAVRDEMLTLWTQQLRGPMADLESQARAALDDFKTEGYTGAAEPKLRKLVDEAALVGRVTAGWEEQGPGAPGRAGIPR